MRIFKLILVLSLSLLFTQGKAHHIFSFKKSGLNIFKKSFEINQLKAFYNDENSSDEYLLVKKKRKPKGRQAIIPSISCYPVGIDFIFKDYPVIREQEAYSSFLYCAKCKRGPPQA